MSDTHNSDHENPCTINDYDEIQSKLVTEDHGGELNIVEMVFDSIDIIEELSIKVEVMDEVTTNMELKPILNESVEELIHFLAIAEKVPAEEIDEFNLFSSKKGDKA
ncbi:hypothetical protein J1N35_025588 [Gossypium stocksii]|uniref:Uncharacterized protein n=1 Tax=Gossypium stocksii TaxID=47602 RepID=A0A9D3ZWC5_9ROSI|nr:hypothetical protein J1N35_025588 [Gossypium stocksii]